MTSGDDFQSRYVTALLTHMAQLAEASLAVGNELGRQALLEQVSMLEIIEGHFRLMDELAAQGPYDGSAALEFLLQTLVPLDVATRGFLDGTKRYAEQRARAEDLADRDAFRRALVNSLQEGFFVADREGAVIEINDAFAEITGYRADGLPYRWHHPWVVDEQMAGEQLVALLQTGNVAYETPIRHRDGHLAWVAISVNVVTEEDGEDRGAYVGTIRDITGARASAVRDGAVVRLATAAGVARTVPEVLAVLLEECRSAIDLRRVVAVRWPKNDGEPTIQSAGDPAELSWRDLDQPLRQSLSDARHWKPLTVQPVELAEAPGRARGIITVLSGAGDVALWLEYNAPRRIDADDRLLVRALVGHLSLAVQHVQQFETAREASLTLQRAMLPTVQTPVGFAVRYEPAVPPLEIGGDWYDVFEVRDGLIGIIVGDCVGRGLPAAAVMGQLRSSARALLLAGTEPGRVLDQLDAVAALIPGAYCATVFAGLLDIDSGALQYSSAGHLPALLAWPDAAPVTLDDAGSVPLSVQRSQPRPQATQMLPPGSTLMLFTDGLVEQKEHAIDAGITKVTKVLTKTLGSTSEAIADAVLSELAPPKGYDDDVALVVYRRPPSPLLLEVPATPDRLGHVRAQLSAWLQGAGASETLIADIVLAGNEACTNSAEHAYRGGDVGTMKVGAWLREGEIVLSVLDFGTWKPPSGDNPFRGRGIPLMRALSDRIQMDHTSSGTTVEMAFGLL